MLIDNDNSDNDGDDEDGDDDDNDDDSPRCGRIGGWIYFDRAHHDHRDGGGCGDVVGEANDDGDDAAARTPTTGTPMTTTRTTEMTQ